MSSPALRRRYSLLSAVRLPPDRDKEKKKMNMRIVCGKISWHSFKTVAEAENKLKSRPRCFMPHYNYHIKPCHRHQLMLTFIFNIIWNHLSAWSDMMPYFAL